MANNIEKFGTPKSMKGLELEEGLADYEEEKIEAATEETRKKTQKALEKREQEHAEEKELWQKRVNDLFQSGNFDEIKTLLRARPELKPNPEIVRARLNELITARPSNWERIFSDIQSFSDVRPDPAVVAQEFETLFAKFGNEKRILDQLKTFKKVTAFTPTPEQIQEKYKAILKGQKSYSFDTEDLFKDIQALTGERADRALFDDVIADGRIDDIKKYAPLFGVELSGEIVQSIYEAHFAKHDSLSTYTISQLPEKPNAALMQKVYAKIIEQRSDRWISTLQELEKETDVKPTFSSEQVQSIFEEFLSKGWYGRSGYIGIEQVIELTGTHPSPEAIQKRALQVVDGGHQYIDQGKRIKDGIQALEAATGTKVEIPEQEIQSRYQQAMTDRKAHVITNLYGAFGIKPAIDDQAAQQFLASFADTTYQNPIEELEKVFGVKLEVSDQDASTKLDEALADLSFDKVKKIQELTGQQPDRKKLEAALVQKLEKEVARPKHERGGYGSSDWQKGVLKLFEDFGIPIPEKVITKIYEQLIDNDTIYTDSLEKVHEISGVAIPAELAQRAYENILAPDYAAYVVEGSTHHGYGRSSAIEKIHQMSGNTPISIPEGQVQSFYRACLDDEGKRTFENAKSEIRKVSELTAIAPQFDSTDINQLYKKWILGGRVDRVKSCQDITDVELQLDEETSRYVSDNISEGLAKASSANYTREEFGETKFDSYRLEEDLRKVAKLVESTGVSPDPTKLQEMYVAVLESDPYCFTVIRQVAKATGIEPQFTPEQVQAKGVQLLEEGALRGFESLLKYGEFSYDQANVAKGFQALLDNCREYDEYNRRHYYREGWSDRLLKLKELSGISPNEEHLAQLFSHFIQSQRRGYRVVDGAVGFLEEQFETEVDESLAQKIYEVLLKDKNIRAIEELKEKTKIVPQIPTEVLQGAVDTYLGDKEYDELSQLKKVLELDSLPATESSVQDVYAQLLSADDFTKEGSAARKAFFTLHSLTGIHPQCTGEQLGQIYGNTRFKDWQSFSQALGEKPSAEAVQNKYYQFLVGRHWKLDDDISAIEEFSGVKIEEATVKRALDICAQGAEIEKMTKIAEVTGLSPEVSNQAVQQGYRKLLEEYKPHSSMGDKIAAAVDYFHGTLGIAPDREVLALAYQQLLGETVYKYGYEKEGKTEYPQWWDILRNKFGMPSAEAVQGTYYAQINQENLWQAIRHLEYIQSFSGISPNIDEMVRALQAQGVERGEIEQKLQSIYQAELLAGRLENIEKLTAQWQLPFQVTEAEAELLYARILMEGKEHQVAMFQFMRENSGFEPAEEIVRNRYQELVERSNLDEMLEFRNMMGWEPAMSKEEVAEHILQAGKGNLMAESYDHPLFDTYHKHVVGQIGEENFDKYKDQILDLFRDNEVLILQEPDFEVIEQNKLNTLTFSEINQLRRSNQLSKFSLGTSEDAEKAYLAIRETGKDWQDSEINRRFEEGSKLFGYHRMLAFAKAGQRHDALYGFERILELHKASGLKPERFYHTILQQVAMDAGTYGEYGDTAFQTLNSIAQGFQDNIEETLAQAREIKGIPQLDALVGNLKRPQDVFSSWKMLIQYKELVSLLERREILDELSREENPRLRGYVSTLLFHPSVTDTHAVKLFWQRPYDFFELESSHTSRELHDLKKPTNYVRIPNLDLAPAELRDALVDGALDRVQVWQPLEATYDLPSNPREWEQYQEFSQKSLSAILQEALGPESKGVKNKKKLFGKIRTLIEAQLDPKQFSQTRRVATEIVQQLVRGEEVPEITLSDVAQKEIRDAVYFGNFGYSKRMKTQKYKVKINLKSNPEGVVAGNDTQCCMPFGDGKNTLYTYNPICALMTVQRETGRGEYRTIAQSVLTKDKDVKAPISEIRGRFEEIESGQVDMTDLLPQDILHRERSYVACDSVEVANNYHTPEYSEVLANLYRDFLREYVARFGEDQHLDRKKAVLGSCTYALAGTTNESNTYLPESPVAYSDKYGGSVDVLSLEQTPVAFFAKRNIELSRIERAERVPIQNPQIEYLSYQDSLETAYIEGKAYESTTLKQGVAEMENALIAKDINNAAKGRANMSLKHVSSDGQMQAYLVAYEGQYGYGFAEEEYEDEYYEEEEAEREPCVYVMDIAKLPEVKNGVGMELIGEFIRLYQENYIKKDKLIPIRAEAREVSSYKLIMRNLDTWGRSIGIKFELEEGEPYQKGEDVMHPVAIRPIRVEG